MKFSEAVALVEANELGRFISKHSNGEYAVVSACRGELSKAENYKRTKELKEKLQASKFSFKPVKGGYIENLGKSNQKEVYENYSTMLLSSARNMSKILFFILSMEKSQLITIRMVQKNSLLERI